MLNAYNARPKLDLYICLPEGKNPLGDSSSLLIEDYSFSYRTCPETNSEKLIYKQNIRSQLKLDYKISKKLLLSSLLWV